MKKYVFKGRTFAWEDMLAAKKSPHKFIKEFTEGNNKKIKTEYHVNKLANSLHPKTQVVTVKEIIKETPDTKTIVLRGANGKIAYFRAGQYISVHLNINGSKIVRPYSLSSSPKQALKQGIYEITVRDKKNGIATDYLLRKLKVGDKLTITSPQGDFYYDDLRDPKNIVALARGSGITPFLSLAKAICDGDEDFNLTILYGNKTKKNIIQLKELNELAKKSNGKVKVVHIVSGEKIKNMEFGVINLEYIKKYMDKKSAIWLCGSKSFYKKILVEIDKLKLPKKHIRIEKNNDIGFPDDYSEYKNIGHKKVYNIIVHHQGRVHNIKANANETILVSLQKAKLDTNSNCLRGLCSWCRVKVINGSYFSPKDYASIRSKDKDTNICYSCSSFPVTDMEIESY